MRAWLRSVRNGFSKRFSWKNKQPSELAAEAYFESMGWKFEHFGWDRARISTRGLPEKYRFMPDYIVTKKGKHFFYECKGMSSRKKVLRIKPRDLKVLSEHYTADLELRVFVYALPSSAMYDVPFDVLWKAQTAEVETAYDGVQFMVYSLKTFAEYEVELNGET